MRDFSVSEITLDQIFINIAGAAAVAATRKAMEEAEEQMLANARM